MAASGRVERDAGDALDLVRRIRRHVVGGCPVGGAAFLAEVRAARQFAHDQDVDAPGHDFVFQRACAFQRIPHLCRAKVREEPELGAEREKGAPFGTLLRRQRVPFGTAHRAKENRVRRLARGERRIGQAVPAQIMRHAADGMLGHLEVVPEPRYDGLEHLDRLRDDLRPDAVAWKQDYVRLHFLVPFRYAARPPAAISSIMKGGNGSA